MVVQSVLTAVHRKTLFYCIVIYCLVHSKTTFYVLVILAAENCNYCHFLIAIKQKQQNLFIFQLKIRFVRSVKLNVYLVAWANYGFTSPHFLVYTVFISKMRYDKSWKLLAMKFIFLKRSFTNLKPMIVYLQYFS